MRTLIFAVILVVVSVLQFVFACQSKYSVETMQYVANGQKIYVAHCQNCHGAKGEGLGMLYPPLTDGKYLREQRETLPRIVRSGMTGPIVIHGETYDGLMPGNPSLSDIDIAYVLTFITVQFGADVRTFTLEEVKEYLRSK